MQSSQVKYIFSDPSFLSNPIQKTIDFPNYSYPFPKHAVLSHFHFNLQKPIASARKKRRHSGFVRSTKIMLESAYFIASKLNILPEPFDSIIREFGGGNGGGFRFWRGHGFDGWRRRKKINWGFWVLLVIIGVGLWLILAKELEIDVFLGILGLTLFGFSVNVWKRGVSDWALGFCCCAALLGFLLREDLLKRVGFFGTVKIARRRKR
ncbi:uncharacterized protein LOC107776745 [Nicotiana tabacum]|uniref:Uncharacterized protein LOC107776745 n=2 Tax=Nicotiana TaxID=4085 RepID=A0A1S3YIT1_TOBAC|nr:PREDICTED: uncharacterized protein LOC107776745 [Nicotiana tabacum]